jgi:hypothetical protein
MHHDTYPGNTKQMHYRVKCATEQDPLVVAGRS